MASQKAGTFDLQRPAQITVDALGTYDSADLAVLRLYLTRGEQGTPELAAQSMVRQGKALAASYSRHLLPGHYKWMARLEAANGGAIVKPKIDVSHRQYEQGDPLYGSFVARLFASEAASFMSFGGLRALDFAAQCSVMTDGLPAGDELVFQIAYQDPSVAAAQMSPELRTVGLTSGNRPINPYRLRRVVRGDGIHRLELRTRHAPLTLAHGVSINVSGTGKP